MKVKFLSFTKKSLKGPFLRTFFFVKFGLLNLAR